jgi:hypothetical protein
VSELAEPTGQPAEDKWACEWDSALYSEYLNLEPEAASHALFVKLRWRDSHRSRASRVIENLGDGIKVGGSLIGIVLLSVSALCIFGLPVAVVAYYAYRHSSTGAMIAAVILTGGIAYAAFRGGMWWARRRDRKNETVVREPRRLRNARPSLRQDDDPEVRMKDWVMQNVPKEPTMVRACLDYYQHCEANGLHLEQPSSESSVEVRDGKTYGVLRNTDGLIAVYRVDDGEPSKRIELDDWKERL